MRLVVQYSLVQASIVRVGWSRTDGTLFLFCQTFIPTRNELSTVNTVDVMLEISNKYYRIVSSHHRKFGYFSKPKTKNGQETEKYIM
jgi:hypothetical protein